MTRNDVENAFRIRFYSIPQIQKGIKMLYRPTFCCECGERIERVEWKIWTNRRFCELCETDHSIQDWAMKIVLCGGLIFSTLFIVNSIVSSGRSVNTGSVKTLKNSSPIVEPGNQGALKDLAPGNDNQNGSVVRDSPSKGQPIAEGAYPVETVNRKSQTETLHNQQITSATPVYFCGAETKKGSPCSRRVKGGGRCWQHIGLKAMLPESRLLVSQ